MSRPVQAVPHWPVHIVLTFLLASVIWRWVAVHYPHTAWDFAQFYIVGNIPLGSLYDRPTVREYGDRVLKPQGIDYYPPYVRPAVFAVPVRAVTWLPYWVAYPVWAVTQFLAYALAIALMYRRFPFPLWWLLPLPLFYPAMMGLIKGQDACAYTLLLVVALELLLRGRDVAAGIVLALGLYKFNLILLVPPVLFMKGRLRCSAAFAIAGGCLAAISALLVSPLQYITLLRNIQQLTIDFSPAKMLGLRGFAHAIGVPSLYLPAAAVVVVATMVAIRRLGLAEAVAMSALGSILIAYHANWYDGVAALMAMILLLRRGGRLDRLGVLVATLTPLWDVYPAIVTSLLAALWGLLAVRGLTGPDEVGPHNGTRDHEAACLLRHSR